MGSLMAGASVDPAEVAQDALNNGFHLAAVGAVVHVMGAFEEQLRRDLPHFALAESLREDRAPDLRPSSVPATPCRFS